MTILVVHPDLRKIGGAELVCLHVIGCLMRDPEVSITLLTFHQAEVANDVRILGYKIDSERFQLQIARLPFFVPKEGPQAMARLAWLHHSARRRSANFDIGISTYNEIHLGIPTLQYIHHPFYVGVDLLKKHRLASESVVSAKSRLRHRVYDAINRIVASADTANFQRNLTLTNSSYMAGIVSNCYGIQPVVLYPSFVTQSEKVESALDREPRVLIAGRFAPDKEIVPFLEAALTDCPLPIDVAGLSVDTDYTNRIHDISSRSLGKITVHSDIAQSEMNSLFRRNRYYVNTRQFEHFGIATLEAAVAGCLPFVHASGGSPEIVPFAELQYNSAHDVFLRIKQLEADPTYLMRLNDMVKQHVHRFDLGHFDEGLMSAFRSLSANVLRP